PHDIRFAECLPIEIDHRSYGCGAHATVRLCAEPGRPLSANHIIEVRSGALFELLARKAFTVVAGARSAASRARAGHKRYEQCCACEDSANHGVSPCRD